MSFFNFNLLHFSDVLTFSPIIHISKIILTKSLFFKYLSMIWFPLTRLVPGLTPYLKLYVLSVTFLSALKCIMTPSRSFHLHLANFSLLCTKYRYKALVPRMSSPWPSKLYWQTFLCVLMTYLVLSVVVFFTLKC